MATTPLDGLRFASQDATAGADGQQGSLSWTACAGQWPLMMRPTCSSASVCVGVYTASVNRRNLKATQSCVPPASLPQHPPPPSSSGVGLPHCRPHNVPASPAPSPLPHSYLFRASDIPLLSLSPTASLSRLPRLWLWSTGRVDRKQSLAGGSCVHAQPIHFTCPWA